MNRGREQSNTTELQAFAGIAVCVFFLAATLVHPIGKSYISLLSIKTALAETSAAQSIGIKQEAALHKRLLGLESVVKARINSGKGIQFNEWQYINRESLSTIITKAARVVFFIFAVLLSVICVRSEILHRKRLSYSPTPVHPQSGVKGFISMCSQFLSPESVAKFKENPSPSMALEAFSLIRNSYNIAPNWAARYFPKGSSHRNVILSYGRDSVVDTGGVIETSSEEKKEEGGMS